MGWDGVEAFFRGVGQVLEREGGTLVVYGPFNHDGGYTSDSNRDFDAWLKARDPRPGIRDFEAVDGLARGVGLRLRDDFALPANTPCLTRHMEPRPFPVTRAFNGACSHSRPPSHCPIS